MICRGVGPAGSGATFTASGPSLSEKVEAVLCSVALLKLPIYQLDTCACHPLFSQSGILSDDSYGATIRCNDTHCRR